MAKIPRPEILVVASALQSELIATYHKKNTPAYKKKKRDLERLISWCYNCGFEKEILSLELEAARRRNSVNQYA
tara:strand:- start:534 stop:755 length:222 start_codon:yes stop_codon:yes gene_type:complete